MMKKFFIGVLFFNLVIVAQNTDLLVFSYNRPMQLYALLESIENYATGLGEIFIIYRASDERYAHAYEKVMQRFPAHFLHQDNPPHDFKKLTLECADKTNHDYILFAVDDDMVKNFVDFQECIELMEQYNAYGFYLRLGKHLNYCYAMLMDQGLPAFIEDDGTICLWRFADGHADWNYPHSLDMTLYRKKDVLPLLHELEYNGPNQLEHFLAIRADGQRWGICYESSKMINFPINIVQNYTHNNSTNSYSTLDLLLMFEQGLLIDIQPLYDYRNRACHESECELAFKKR